MFTILLVVRVIWTSWAHVWRLRFCFLEPRCDIGYPSLIWLLSRVLETSRTCLGFWHATARLPWGAIKAPSCLSSMVDHSVQLINTLRHSLELSTSLLQASLERFESHSWVTHSIFNLNTSPMIFVCLLLLGIHSPRRTRLSESHQGCGGLQKVCIALSFVEIW
jgi:hypothetical protein